MAGARRGGLPTPQQMRLCNDYMELGSAEAAYRANYKTVWGAKAWGDDFCRAKASVVMRKPSVKRYMDELRKKVIKRTGISIAGLTVTLEKVVKRGLELDKLAEVTSAVVAVAKLNGLWVERSKTEHIWHQEKTAAEIEKEIEDALIELNVGPEANALIRRIQAQGTTRAVGVEPAGADPEA